MKDLSTSGTKCTILEHYAFFTEKLTAQHPIAKQEDHFSQFHRAF